MEKMGNIRARACWLLLYMLVAFVMAVRLTAVADAGTVQLDAIHWDDAYQRWRDIATYPYDKEKKASYQYDQALVTVDYELNAPSFIGTLAASNLKPNFAYHIKLNGKPTLSWGQSGDDWANEQLGYSGRWWVNQYDLNWNWIAGWNGTDDEYGFWKANGFTDGEYFYVFDGYLLFDYVVTDPNGTASKSFALDSSFHVLWKTSQRQPTANDSTPTSHTVVANRSSNWYSRKLRTKTIEIYGEWEPGRSLPGECALPAGDYNVRIFLTEESFHESTPDSGSWATVMAYDEVVFTIDGQPWPPPPPPTGTIVGTVTDALTGRPIRRATVRATQNGEEMVRTTTNGKGNYMIEGLAVGDYMVEASASRYITQTKPTTVYIDTTTTVDFSLVK